jgi:Family of unknown function (DUF6086)
MSFVFEADNETVWSPALRAGKAFVGCAQALAQAADISPGFSFNAEDTVEIDVPQLEAFSNALGRLLTGPMAHSVLADLARAVRVPCLVMLERAGHTAERSPDLRTAQLIEQARATMPR